MIDLALTWGDTVLARGNGAIAWVGGAFAIVLLLLVYVALLRRRVGTLRWRYREMSDRAINGVIELCESLKLDGKGGRLAASVNIAEVDASREQFEEEWIEINAETARLMGCAYMPWFGQRDSWYVLKEPAGNVERGREQGKRVEKMIRQGLIDRWEKQ